MAKDENTTLTDAIERHRRALEGWGAASKAADQCFQTARDSAAAKETSEAALMAAMEREAEVGRQIACSRYRKKTHFLQALRCLHETQRALYGAPDYDAEFGVVLLAIEEYFGIGDDEAEQEAA